MRLTCNLDKYKGCYVKERSGDKVPIASFVIRDTDGEDETRATLRAQARGDTGSATEEAIRSSFVEVNGEPVNVGSPYGDFDRWSSRARSFAIAAWKRLNSVDDAEGKDFLALAELTDD